MAVTELLEPKFGGDILLFLPYSSLFIRSESKSQASNTYGKGLTQGSEQQEVGIIRSPLLGCLL